MAFYPVSLYHPLAAKRCGTFPDPGAAQTGMGTMSPFCYLTRYVAVIADRAAVKTLG
jgi:hypothetical protein